MATYTVRAGDTWFSLASKLGVDARTLRRQNRGTTLARGVVIRTGGARYTRPLDINPWGLPAGQVPEYAAGTDAAKRYLWAIGGGGGVAEEAPSGEPIGMPGEEPGVTPIGGAVSEEEFTARAESYARQMGAELPAETVTQAAGIGEPITMPGLTGVGIGPRPLGGPGAFGQGPVSMPTGEPLVTVGGGVAGPFGMGEPSFAPSMAPTQAVAGPYGRGPLGPSLARPRTEYVRPTPAGEPEIADTAIMPIDPQSPQGIYLAARWTGQAIAEYRRTGNRNYLPNVITTPVALHFIGAETQWTTSTGVTGTSGGWLQTAEGESIGTISELFSGDNLSYTEIEPGVWVKNPEITYSGGYGGSIGYTGRRYGRGRGTRGGRYAAPTSAGGTQYGPRLTQWRHAFGG